MTIGPDCKQTIYSIKDQTAIWLLDEVKSRLDQQVSRDVCDIQMGRGKQKSLEIISYNDDGSTENILSLNVNHSSDDIAIVKQASIFFERGVLTLIYRDGKIEMKPAVCMTDEEKKFLESLRSTERVYRKLIQKSEREIETMVEEFSSKLASNRSIGI